MKVFRDSNLAEQFDRRAALDYSRRALGFSSPLWVTCPRCAVGRGDPCRHDETCEARVAANAARLLALPTWGVGFATPCCGLTTWLVWRSAADELRWHGVPCQGCDTTFTAELYASDLVPHRVPMPRLHPDRVEAVCWALTE